MIPVWVVAVLIAAMAASFVGFMLRAAREESKQARRLAEVYELGFHFGQVNGNLTGYTDGFQDGVNQHHRDTK